MQLIPNCLRDILLEVEKNSIPEHLFSFLDDEAISSGGTVTPAQERLLEKYPSNVLCYHVRYCIDAGYVVPYGSTDGHLYVISDLTPSGHDYAACCRDENHWLELKEILAVDGDFSPDTTIAVSRSLSAAKAPALAASVLAGKLPDKS